MFALVTVWGILDVQTAFISHEKYYSWGRQKDNDLSNEEVDEETEDDHEYLPDDFADDMSNDKEAEITDYYNNGVDKRGAGCYDAFKMCLRFRKFRGKCDKIVRKKAFAMRFCRRSCHLC